MINFGINSGLYSGIYFRRVYTDMFGFAEYDRLSRRVIEGEAKLYGLAFRFLSICKRYRSIELSVFRINQNHSKAAIL